MEAYRRMGREDTKQAWQQAHRAYLHQWFNMEGDFVHHGTQPSSRERLWNCFSLYDSSDSNDHALADAIVRKTPIDHNHFQPIAAVNLLLSYKGRLIPETESRLTEMVTRHLVNIMEVRMASPGLNNFSCMSTFFLLGAGQVLDSFPFDHEFNSIPEVYVGERITDMGLNGLRALAYVADHAPVADEFNSPTYSPISLHSMAKIVELIDHPLAKKMALAVELYLWREILALYHPNLGLSCGPFSRAYRVDILGHKSQMRVLLCYLGLSKDSCLVSLFEDHHPDLLFHHDGDIPFCWSGPAWQMAEPFHVPESALDALANREYPQRFEADISWESFGYIDPETHSYVSVQGTAWPGGEATITQEQGPNHALGWRSKASLGHRFPIMLHYGLKQPVQTMRDVRTVTGAVMLQTAPEEWTTNQEGAPIESSNFNNSGHVDVLKADDNTLQFKGTCASELALLYSTELSISTFIPRHFNPIGEVSLNGVTFEGEVLSIETDHAVMRVDDHGTCYEVSYRFAEPVTVRLYHWAKFLRFAGFWHEGEETLFAPDALNAMQVDGTFRLLSTGQ